MIQIRHFARQLATVQLVHKLLGDGDFLLIVAVGEADVHFGTQTGGKGRDLDGFLAQIYDDIVGLVNGKDGADSQHLQLNLFAIDHFGGRNEGIVHNRTIGALVENERLELAADFDRDTVAIVQVNLLLGVRDFHRNNSLFGNFLHGRFFRVVFHHPLETAVLVLENGETLERHLLFLFGRGQGGGFGQG